MQTPNSIADKMLAKWALCWNNYQCSFYDVIAAIIMLFYVLGGQLASNAKQRYKNCCACVKIRAHKKRNVYTVDSNGQISIRKHCNPKMEYKETSEISTEAPQSNWWCGRVCCMHKAGMKCICDLLLLLCEISFTSKPGTKDGDDT